MTSPDELMRSVNEFLATLDSIGSQGVSQAVELTQLDRLVRRYPEAARKRSGRERQEARQGRRSTGGP
jgi:hypothetical protein